MDSFIRKSDYCFSQSTKRKLKNPMEDEDKPMDEFEWEQFLKKNDEMVDKFSALMEKYIDDPNRDEIIAREMGWNYLLDDKEDDGIERPWLDEFNESLNTMDDEVEEGDEWKVLAGIEETLQHDYLEDLRNNPIHKKAHDLAANVIHWSQELPELQREDQLIVDIITNITIAAAKTAGGTAFSHEEFEDYGAVIAIHKRALGTLNKALLLLSELKSKNSVDEQQMIDLIKETTDVRNTIAIYIVDTREKFSGRK